MYDSKLLLTISFRFLFSFFWAEACIDDITEEAQVEVSSGRGHDQKHPTLKRAAPTETTAAKLPKMKKKKIDAMDDAIYQRYCCTNYKIKDPPRGEPL